jgi:hypothetical protein
MNKVPSFCRGSAKRQQCHQRRDRARMQPRYRRLREHMSRSITDVSIRHHNGMMFLLPAIHLSVLRSIHPSALHDILAQHLRSPISSFIVLASDCRNSAVYSLYFPSDSLGLRSSAAITAPSGCYSHVDSRKHAPNRVYGAV